MNRATSSRYGLGSRPTAARARGRLRKRHRTGASRAWWLAHPAQAAHDRGDSASEMPDLRATASRQPDHPLGLAPALEPDGGVDPHHENEIAFASFLSKQLQSLIRVGRPLAFGLQCRDGEARVVRGGQPGHRHPQLFSPDRLRSACGATPVGTKMTSARPGCHRGKAQQLSSVVFFRLKTASSRCVTFIWNLPCFDNLCF